MKDLIIKIRRAPAPDVYHEVYGEEADAIFGEKYYFYAVEKEENEPKDALLTSSLYVSIAECAAAAVELLPLASFSSEWAGHPGIACLTRNSLINSMVSRSLYGDERDLNRLGKEEMLNRFKGWNDKSEEIIEEEITDILATKARAKMLGIALD